MKKLMILIGLIVVLGTFGNVASRSSTDEIIARYETEYKSKQAVLKILRDPESAKFGVMFHRQGYICGYVNAKNAYGAYTGMREFITTKEHATVADGSVLFIKTWNSKCSGPI